MQMNEPYAGSSWYERTVPFLKALYLFFFVQSISPFKNNVETSQLICIRNQVTGFYMRRALVINT